MYYVTSRITIIGNPDLRVKDPVSQVQSADEFQEVRENDDDEDILITVLPAGWWNNLTRNKGPEKEGVPSPKDLSIAFFLFATLIHEASHLKVSSMSSVAFNSESCTGMSSKIICLSHWTQEKKIMYKANPSARRSSKKSLVGGSNANCSRITGYVGSVAASGRMTTR